MAKEIHKDEHAEAEDGEHDGVAGVYDEKKKGWYVNRFRPLPERIAELTGKERPRVLDFGCGTGLILSWFSGERVGVDISEGMLEMARRQRPGPRYILSDVRDFRTDERFDAILLIELIEFVDDLSFLSNLYGMLNENGVLLIANINPKTRPIIWLLDRLKMKLPTGRWLWRKPEEIRDAIKRAGFSRVTSESRFPHIYYWGFR